MAFESDHRLTMDGIAGTAVWHALFKAVAAGQDNTHGYTYARATKDSPETLTIWHDGHRVFHSLANTGIPVAPTDDRHRPGLPPVPVPDHEGHEPGRQQVRRPGLVRRLLPGRRGRALLPARLLRLPAEPGLRRAAARDGGEGLALPHLRHPRHGLAAARLTGRRGDGLGASRASIASGTGRGRRRCHPSALGAAVPADKLHITLAGREHVVEAGTTAGQALDCPGEHAHPPPAP